MADISLDDWVAALAAELEIDDLEVDVDLVLDLAADAAHSIERPAAPITTFVAGFAAARAGGSADAVREAVDAASALCVRVGDEV